MPATNHSLILTLRLLGSEEGGRSSAIRSGYCSLIHFNSVDGDFGCELTIPGDSLSPGGVAAVTATIWAGDQLPDLEDGTLFELREGGRVVGTGLVTNDPELASQMTSGLESMTAQTRLQAKVVTDETYRPPIAGRFRDGRPQAHSRLRVLGSGHDDRTGDRYYIVQDGGSGASWLRADEIDLHPDEPSP
jgi:hypothetical protein